jgi:hypothetical protein
MKMTAKKFAEAAQEALKNWDADLMQPGQAQVLEAIVNNPANFADTNGEVDTGKRDVWDYLEEISSSLSA